MYQLTLFTILCGLLSQASGHGILMEPVGRASAWRVGFPTPKNYDDNALFCGGFATQQANGGKCGVCGDPWNGRRDNEAGGKFATGTIVRKYKMGQVITTKVDITANHFGWMEYRICPNNNIHKPVTHECLDRYVLQRADGKGTKVFIDTKRTGLWNMDYKLPDGLTCTQCVIQWKYHAGNSWGVDKATGRACIGCGPQEEFYGCADVAIEGDTPVPNPTPSPSTVTPSTRSTQPVTAPAGFQPVPLNPASSTQCRGINNWAGMPDMDRWCTEECAKGNCPVYGCSCTGGNPVTQQLQTTITTRPTTTTTRTTITTTTPTTTTSTTTTTPTTTTTSTTTTTTPKSETQIMTRRQCKAINLWAGNEYLDRWCADACARGNCPPDSCYCEDIQLTVTVPTSTDSGAPTPQPTVPVAKVCKALSLWKGIAVFDNWCTEECNKGNCPADTCQCTDARLQPLPTTTTTTTTTTKPSAAVKPHPVCTSNGVVGGDYWNGWCQQNCDRNYCPLDYCLCS